MSLSSGGRADKLGNRYEGLWVAYDLLRLLWEDVATVQLEAVGDDEKGVDVWVTHRDGTRDAQQCKRKNGSSGKWTVAKLEQQEVLKRLAEQLRRDTSATFTFVSADPTPELRELAETARGAGDSAEDYFRATLKVDAHAPNLRRFCSAVGVSENDPNGRRDAFDLLRRTHTHYFGDEREARASAALHARSLIVGDPRTALEVLATLAQDRMGTALTVDHVRDHLRERGFGLVRLVGDTRIAERLEQLRQDFRESLRPSLIHSSLVSRPEAATAFDLLTTRSDRPLVLHGRAGAGKSCVLLQLTELLERRVPYLPLRLDRRPPQTSSRQYGISCDLPESPAVVLHALHPDRRAVLIVDQLDAIRWTSAHAVAPWEACQEVIDDALRLPNVSVVVACRTFDLRDDQQISAWQSQRRGHELEVGELPAAAVEATVTAAGAVYAELTPRQQGLLRSPLHLALWTQVRRELTGPNGWDSQTDLLRAFWASRYDAARRLGVASPELRNAVTALVTHMDNRGELAAPARLLDPYPEAAKALKSLNVVVEANRSVTFVHQSYFEYQLATQLLDRIRDQEGAVATWVRGSDQSLLRREQLRLVLTLLRDEAAREYLRTIRALLLAPTREVRFHLRQLVLRLLGESPQPSVAEGDLVYELARVPALREHVFDQVFIRQVVWFGAMDERGLLDGWLSSSDERLIGAGVQFCRLFSSQWGDRVARLLGPYLDRPDPWPRRVASALPFNPADDSDALFGLRLQIVRRGVSRNPRLSAKELAERNPTRLIDLLEAHLDRRHAAPEEPGDAPRAGQQFPFSLPHSEVEHVLRVSEALPQRFWTRLVPRVVRACETTRGAGDEHRWPPFYRDATWDPDRRAYARDGYTELPELVARAGALVATQNPTQFAVDFAACLDHPGLSVQFMIGLALTGAGEPAADLAVGWLCANAGRLSLPDERGASWGIAQRLIRRHAGTCSPDAYARLEQCILTYHEPDERRSAEWQLRRVGEAGDLSPNRWGLAQHALLPCLPEHRLSAGARSELGVLACKFQRPADAYATPFWSRSGRLGGPIPAARVARLTDQTWLGIIGSDAGTRNPRRYRDDHCADTSVEGYARLLGERTRWEPQRFASFALRIPTDADPEYLAAVLHGLVATDPPSTECTNWKPVDDARVTAVIEHVGYREVRQIADRLCWMMRQRPLALSTAASLQILGRYATDHPEPDWVLTSNQAPDHEAASINCVRGSALGLKQANPSACLLDFPVQPAGDVISGRCRSRPV